MTIDGKPSSRCDRAARAVLTGLLYATPALMCFHVCSATVADPDIWWHLRTGEWIVQHRAFPRTDPFSGFCAGKAWEAYSWLFDLIVFQLYRWFDLAGLVAYTSTAVLLISVAAHRFIGRLQPDFTKAILLTLAFMVSISRLYTPRPWLFTILFFVLECDILMYARKTGETRSLLWLPPLFALWANLHIQFLDGLLVLGVASLEASFRRLGSTPDPRLPAAKAWMVFAACLLATLVNPYGYRIYQAAYELASQPGVLNRVGEMQSMPFRAWSDFLLLFLALFAAGALAWNRRFPLFETALLAIAAILSFRSQRDLWFMAAIATAILATYLPSQTRRQMPSLGRFRPVAAATTAVLLLAGVVLMRVDNSRLHSLLAESLPVQAVEVAKDRGYGGVLFNNYDWGGFMIWSLRVPVSIDGRAALQGDSHIARSYATWSGAPDWRSDPGLIAADLVIAPIKAPLAQLLRMDPGFQLVYRDKVAALFIARRQHPKQLPKAELYHSGISARTCGANSSRGSSCAS